MRSRRSVADGTVAETARPCKHLAAAASRTPPPRTADRAVAGRPEPHSLKRGRGPRGCRARSATLPASQFSGQTGHGIEGGLNLPDALRAASTGQVSDEHLCRRAGERSLRRGRCGRCGCCVMGCAGEAVGITPLMSCRSGDWMRLDRRSGIGIVCADAV